MAQAPNKTNAKNMVCRGLLLILHALVQTFWQGAKRYNAPVKTGAPLSNYLNNCEAKPPNKEAPAPEISEPPLLF